MLHRGCRNVAIKSGLFAAFITTVALLTPSAAQAVEPPKSEPEPAATAPVVPAVSDDEVQVVAPKEKGKPISPFLVRPGTDRYDSSSIDWDDVPEWRQASFFGIRAQGQFFMYVVDCSGSMIDQDRISRAKAEVRKSVARLKEPQRFKVIFYNDVPIAMPGAGSLSADFASKDHLLQWLKLIEPDGGTDPRSSLRMALNYRPDAIFLLSDGEYPEGTADAIKAKNPRRIPIHCIDLSGGAAGDQLKQIAADSGGQYAPRPSSMGR